MKKLLITIVVVAIALLGVPLSASAEAPHLVSADFTYVPNCPPEDMKLADDNMFLYCTDEGSWEGDFIGTSFEEYVAVLHGFVEPFGFDTGFYKGTATFTGSVEENEGTLEILFIGKSSEILTIGLARGESLAGQMSWKTSMEREPSIIMGHLIYILMDKSTSTPDQVKSDNFLGDWAETNRVSAQYLPGYQQKIRLIHLPDPS